MLQPFQLKNFIASTLFVLPMIIKAQQQTSYQPPVFNDPDRLKRIEVLFPAVEKIYKEYAESNHFPGYTFGIMLDGKLVYSGSGGYSDINKKIPATTKSMFRIASMSKSFTAMAILKLRDEGKLKLDDPVSKYIPELKNQKHADGRCAGYYCSQFTYALCRFSRRQSLGRQTISRYG